MGVGQRTEPGAGKQLSEISGRPVIEIPTEDPFFYHADTFLSFLPGGHVVVYKDALPQAAVDVLKQFYDDKHMLVINRSEAMTFAANLQSISQYYPKKKPIHHVLLPADCPRRITDKLESWKYKLIPVAIKALRHAGGGLHCCYQRVWDLREYPLQPLPTHLNELIAQRNQGLTEKRRLRVWVNGKLQHYEDPKHAEHPNLQA